MDDLDRKILDAVQQRVPLVREPYAQLAGELGTEEPTLLVRLAALRGDDVIREISGIFDVRRLGYRQALVAMQIPPEQVDEAGREVATHPGVSHCYARDNAFNLWFTLAVSPGSSLGFDRTVELLDERVGAKRTMALPSLRRFKLRVQFMGASTVSAAPETAEHDEGSEPLQLNDAQRRAVRVLQCDLPNEQDPFAGPAALEDLDPDNLLVHAADFLSAGAMRRYAGVLRHRRAGANANVMVAWQVGEGAAEAAGRECASHRGVSHCYLRPTREDWPYAMYTMIHGHNRQDCEMTIDEIVARTGLRRHIQLWTTAEYAKRRVRLFVDDEARWEGSHA